MSFTLFCFVWINLDQKLRTAALFYPLSQLSRLVSILMTLCGLVYTKYNLCSRIDKNSNVAAHNVSIRNVKVSKRERHIMYSVTKHTENSQNVKCTLHKRYKMFCNGDALRYVTFTF